MTRREVEYLVNHARPPYPEQVGRDNTVAYAGLRLQLPESRTRAHYVKARIKVHEYPDGALAVFHGPRLLARYDAAGRAIAGENLRVAA